jgi:transposase/transposase-like protein
MLRLDQKADILMKYFREGKSQRKISEELNISRTTVKKYVNEFESKNKELEKLKNENEDREKILRLIEEMTEKPKYDTSSRKKVKLTEEVRKIIGDLIKKNEKNKELGIRKQLMKKVDIYEHLNEEGYEIGYTTVCNYIKEKYEKKEAYIRQEYELGQTIEFDWGEIKLTIGGKYMSLDMGLFTTAKQPYHFARIYHNQKKENFLDIHVRAFNHIGGVHNEALYDNMKTAVKRFVGKTEKEATDDLIKLSLYYGFKYRFCNVRSGNEKGHVERGVEFVRRKIFSFKTEFETVEEANEYLEKGLKKLNEKERKWLGNQSPKEMLEKEKPYLIPLKPSYDSSRKLEARVNKYSVITIDQNKYSVPDYLVGKFVKVKIYPENINIYYKENQVATHKRNYQNHKWIIDINHFIYTLKKKPGALHSSAGMQQISPRLQQIYHKYYTNNPKDFIALLELIKEKDLNVVIEAVEKLSLIKKEIVNTENIKSLVNKTPTANNTVEEKDDTIKEQSINQISTLNQLFKLETVGGYKN